ncbi:hypothetical protein GCM10020229_41880 [Kitasatospora albolonga]
MTLPSEAAKAGHAFDVVDRVGQPGHQHEADPDLLAEVGEAPGEVQGGLQRPSGDLAVELAVPGLDVQQDQVDVGQQFVGGPGAEEAGGVQGGVQAEFVLVAVEQLAGEGRLEQRLAAADGGAAAGGADEGGVLRGLGHHRVGGGAPAVAHLHGVGVVAVEAGQRAPGQEGDEPGARPSTPVERSQECTEPVSAR